MRIDRIQTCANRIAENEAALKWLEEYGVQLTGRDKDAATVSIRLAYAGAFAGAKEAERVLTALARFELPRIVESAIRNCRNTIAMDREAIREELDRDDGGQA